MCIYIAAVRVHLLKMSKGDIYMSLFYKCIYIYIHVYMYVYMYVYIYCGRACSPAQDIER